ncbi:MAG: type I DNA topoisomerase [Dehalococcoidia bacterium]|nr:type I DNA topoisomerase [Dehalococcoidia bacterium]
MANKLVIVESPAKAKTLTKILGKSYIIKASMGHVRDLPPDKLGILIDKEFEPEYRSIRERKHVITEIKELANSASAIYLATDPDREGEAISWHLIKAANLEKDKIPLRRVTFHEITKDAVEEAFDHPRPIDLKLVDAQQARRILDRLVGYKLSPLLWKKVFKGLSAGRVQSVAVRMVVDREREILDFIPVEYWTIEAELTKQKNGKNSFKASFVGLADNGKISIPNKQSCDDILNDLKAAAYAVSTIQSKEVPRNPAPPFITSTMQQEAWRKLRFTAKKTMVIAQQLYEGLPIGEEGDTGLITYMRTDSTNMAATAVEEIRDYIRSNFSAKHLPKSPRVFTKKVKMAQEAHEAIRPTKAFREPEKIKEYLNKDQFQLYELIWKRAVASQMAAALYDTITVDIHATAKKKQKVYLFQTKTSSLRFPGFMALYIEGMDEEKDAYDEGKSVKLPQLTEGEMLLLLDLLPEQFFTQPPPRYTEATLIKALEQKGIGRPSTYAPIISTIVDRGYVYKESGKLRPEEIGMIVNDLLVNSFPNIVDFNFTAKMEDELDEIAQGKMKWRSVIKSFYSPFEKDLSNAQEKLQKIVIQSEEVCPECGKPMVMKSSRYGKFLACSNFPDCKGKKSMNSVRGPAGSGASDKADSTPEVSNEPCPKCGKNMVVRKGRFGTFLACPDYPKCTGKQTIQRYGAQKGDGGNNANETTNEKCPKCGEPMVVRAGRFGKFLACSAYPKCKTTKKIIAADKPDNPGGAAIT